MPQTDYCYSSYQTRKSSGCHQFGEFATLSNVICDVNSIRSSQRSTQNVSYSAPTLITLLTMLTVFSSSAGRKKLGKLLTASGHAPVCNEIVLNPNKQTAITTVTA